MGHRKKKGKESKEQSSTWLDLAIYLVAGIGLFFFTMHLATRAMLSLADELIIADEWPVLYSAVVCSLSAICSGGTVYILGIRRGKITWSGIGLTPMVWRWSWLLVGILAIVLAIPIQALLANWIRRMLIWDPFGMGAQGITQRSLVIGRSYSFSWVKLFLTFLSMGVLAPISEELYFRGLIHSWLQSRFGLGLRIVLSSLIFGLAHLPAVATAVSDFILGLICAVAYERSRSIWLPVALHVIHNVFLVIFIYLALAVLSMASP